LTDVKSSEVLSEKIDTNDTSGENEHMVILKDTLDCEDYHIYYYKNGKVREKGCQGHFNAFGVPLGTWEYYDSLGNLIETRTYRHHDKNGNVTITKLNGNGKRTEEIIQGYDAHFGESDTIWSRKTFIK